MTLQLYLNGDLFNEMHLPVEVFVNDDTIPWKENIIFRKLVLDGFIMEIKGLFWRQLAKVENWELVLVAESKMNNTEVDELIIEKHL